MWSWGCWGGGRTWYRASWCCFVGCWMAARARFRRGGRIYRCGSSRSARWAGSARRWRGGCCWRVASGWRASAVEERGRCGHDGGLWPTLSGLDARVLRATDARYERSPERSVSWRAARWTWRCLRCAGFVSVTWSRMTVNVHSGGCVPTVAMSCWSTSRETVRDVSRDRSQTAAVGAIDRGAPSASVVRCAVQGAAENGGDCAWTARAGDRDRDGHSGGGVGDAAARAPAAGGAAAGAAVGAAGGGGAR